MKRAVIVELDYKGEYERFALTYEDFIRKFVDAFDIPYPDSKTGISRTLQPMVHIWYAYVDIGGESWNLFMNDMEYGISESDVQDGNLAYVNLDRFSKEILEECKSLIWLR